MDNFSPKSSWSVLDDTVTERADIWGFGSTVNAALSASGLTACYRILQKLAAENIGEILLIMISPICKTGSPSCGDLESCYFPSW